jgi:hypothetical protein
MIMRFMQSLLAIHRIEPNGTKVLRLDGGSSKRRRRRTKVREIVLIMSFVVMAANPGMWAHPTVNFSGTWKQCNECCQPKRTGDVTVIEHRDPELMVAMTILRGSAIPRHSTQRYTTDGKQSISIGPDGDEFHTSVIWSGQSLVFTVEEKGQIIHSKETWTVIENGAALKRVQEGPAGGAQRVLIYQKGNRL